MNTYDMKKTNLSLSDNEECNTCIIRKINSKAVLDTFNFKERYSCFLSLISKTSSSSELSDFDNTVKTDFSSLISYGKEGIPLKYSRKKFVSNLYKLLLGKKTKEREELLGILKISFIKQDFSGQSAGYNGILDISGLNLKDETEKMVYDECLKFLFHNQVITGNDNLDIILNAIIKGMPEFVNLIGKKQHRSHDYSVDIHSLAVMHNIIRHPEYVKLSDDDKFVLKMTALLHDIGKPEGVPDKNHPFTSYNLSRHIIKRYNLPAAENDRLLKSIKNHQWLQWYNMSRADVEIVNSLVDDYKKPNDYKMALIMACADLQATSDYINDCYSHLLSRNYQIPIQQAVNKKFATSS